MRVDISYDAGREERIEEGGRREEEGKGTTGKSEERGVSDDYESE